MTEGQVAAEVARLVSAETGRGAAIDGNYVSKLERGKITWPNSAYRRAFRQIFAAQTDADLGFYAMRTRRDAELWLAATDGEAQRTPAATHPPPETRQQAAAPAAVAAPVPASAAGTADRPAPQTRETAPARTSSAARSRPAFRSRDIRWMPVLLASLAATVGWLAYDTVAGQNTASAAHHSYQAGGLRLAVDEMTWIGNGMIGLGSGPLAPAANFSPDPGLPPGMQAIGNKRLHLEVDLENITSNAQNYDDDDFRVIGLGGLNWPCVKIAAIAALSHGRLQPGYKVTLDVYFDIPANEDGHLYVEWSRSGKKVHFPVNTSHDPIPPIGESMRDSGQFTHRIISE